jgi:hypothetical protein
VLAVHKALEGWPISSGDDSVEEEDTPVKPCPIYCEVLQAISTINRYVKYVDNPVARKVEDVLASFAWQLQSERS